MIVYNLFLYYLWSDATKPHHTEPFTYFPEFPYFFLHNTVQPHKYSHTVNCKVSSIASQEENRNCLIQVYVYPTWYTTEKGIIQLYQNGSLNTVKYLERINNKRIQQLELYTQ